MTMAHSTQGLSTPGINASPTTSGQLQLQDIHTPEPVSIWPLAPGWWLLLVLVVLTAILIKYIQHRWLFTWQTKRQLKQHAQQAIMRSYQDWQEHRDISRYCAALNTQLKRYCRCVAPEALPLTGENWVDWMQTHSAARFTNEQRLAFTAGPYLPPKKLDSINADSLRDASLHWLDTATFQISPDTRPQSTLITTTKDNGARK